MKFASLIFFLLAATVTRARGEDNFALRAVVLRGQLSFAAIVREAERQIGVPIMLPVPPDDRVTRAYNDRITLSTLLVAIRDYYGEKGIKVEWRITATGVEVYRSGSLTGEETNAARERRETARSQGKDQGPSRPTGAPGLADIEPLQPDGSAPAAPPPHEPASHDSSFTVAPYPENANAFINDAPPLVPVSGGEKFVEWEARMEGALKQGNSEVLDQEQAEIEERLRWLRKRLPPAGTRRP